MFDPDSRYAGLETATHVAPDGREIVYCTRRFLPRASELTPVARTVVSEGERLDQIAARSLGDPLQYALVCDANEAMNPTELVAAPGRVLLLAGPA